MTSSSSDFLDECMRSAAQARAFSARAEDEQQQHAWRNIAEQWERLIAEYRKHLDADRSS